MWPSQFVQVRTGQVPLATMMGVTAELQSVLKLAQGSCTAEINLCARNANSVRVFPVLTDSTCVEKGYSSLTM